MVHKIPVALIIVAGEALVLVQIHRGNLGEVKAPLLIAVYQLFVGSLRSGACGQAQHTVRFYKDLGSDQIGCPAAQFLIILSSDNSHD